MQLSASVQADQDAQSLHTHQYRCGPHSLGHLGSHVQSYEPGDGTQTCAFSSAWFQMLGIRHRRTLSFREGGTVRLLLCSLETPKASTQAVTEWSVIEMSGHHTSGCKPIRSNPRNRGAHAALCNFFKTIGCITMICTVASSIDYYAKVKTYLRQFTLPTK